MSIRGAAPQAPETRRRVGRLVVACGLAVLAPLAGPSAQHWTLAVTPLQSPAAASTAQPQLSVSERGVLLSWIERSGTYATLKFAERTPAGWTEARTVAAGDDWFVNWADVPSVIRLADGTLAAHWLQKSGPDTYAYDVRLAHSNDDGRTWSPSFLPHHDGTKTEHGFASLFQMPGAGLGLAWLDGRAMTPGGHEGHDGGAMTLRFAAFDRHWKQTADTGVDLRVCECCPTAATVTADGPIVAYRDRSDGEIRDIYVSRLERGAWTTPSAVHADNWKIPACPVNGPSLSARGRDVALAWFTAAGDQGRAFIAFSRDAGRSWSPPVRVDEAGSLGRVDVELLADGSALATWIEFADQRAQFRARRIMRDGTRSAAVTVTGIAGSRSSGYPRVALHGQELVFAWTESEGGLSVKTAVARLPQLTSRD
ncbi:MAG: sialidase family protein [Acidobacteriota bacterium]